MWLVPQTGYCSNIDKKWEKPENQKRKTEETQKKRKAEAIEYDMNLSWQSSSTDFLYDSKENDNLLEEEYCIKPEIHEKHQFNSTIDNDNDDKPYEYRHVRNGSWSVKKNIT